MLLQLARLVECTQYSVGWNPMWPREVGGAVRQGIILHLDAMRSRGPSDLSGKAPLGRARDKSRECCLKGLARAVLVVGEGRHRN